jgi:hypothetical protein
MGLTETTKEYYGCLGWKQELGKEWKVSSRYRQKRKKKKKRLVRERKN